MLRLVVVVSLVMAMAIVQVNGQTTTCAATFIASCNDTSSPTGIAQCCASLRDLYQNDLTCLCSIFQTGNIDPSSAGTLLTGCGVNTGGTSPCPGSPVPVSPTPPNLVPSPPTTITGSPPPPPSFVPSPPATTTGSPTPPSVIPTSPSIFGSQSPPTTPPLLNTPPAVNTPTLGGSSGAPRSSLIGMSSLFFFGLMLVVIT